MFRDIPVSRRHHCCAHREFLSLSFSFSFPLCLLSHFLYSPFLSIASPLFAPTIVSLFVFFRDSFSLFFRSPHTRKKKKERKKSIRRFASIRLRPTYPGYRNIILRCVETNRERRDSFLYVSTGFFHSSLNFYRFVETICSV